MIATVWWVSVALVAQVPPPTAAAAFSVELHRERQAIRERETAELDALAERLRAEGRRSESEAVLARREPPPPVAGPYRFNPLPEVVPARDKGKTPGLANVPADKPAVAGTD